ncbi:lipoprotein [Streptomyces abikoensis]|uniref:lipoprotein n=1 Tax=Streptomyces abikoensis TaxID=97398 RepID=UPI00371CB617
MRKIASGAATALLTVGVLTACSPTDAKSDATPAAESTRPTAPTPEKTAKAAGGLKDGRIGDAGTACTLPVSFEAPKEWKHSGFTDEDNEFLNKWAGHPSVKVACELSASRIGVIGFIRVYTTDGPDKSPRQVLENFVAEEKRVSDPRYTETKLGDLPAAEVVYTQRDALLDEPRTRRGLAVKTAKGLTVLHVEGAESDDPKTVLPAYEQAKATMRATT